MRLPVGDNHSAVTLPSPPATWQVHRLWCGGVSAAAPPSAARGAPRRVPAAPDQDRRGVD
eukprot:350288-Chlamydomonas_euryale.AAC.3